MYGSAIFLHERHKLHQKDNFMVIATVMVALEYGNVPDFYGGVLHEKPCFYFNIQEQVMQPYVSLHIKLSMSHAPLVICV